jgi:hypothetical protein
MTTYYVHKREVHVSTVRVEAASEAEAIEKAKGDDGEEVMCEYSHTLDSDTWTVEEAMAEDSSERLARGWPARDTTTTTTYPTPVTNQED